MSFAAISRIGHFRGAGASVLRNDQSMKIPDLRPTLALWFALLAALFLGGAATAGEPDFWQWPVEQRRELARHFEQPEHEYAAGHRGIKIVADVGASVLSPAGATVLFRGMVAGRGVLTIETAAGLVITLEPIDSALNPGDTVAAGAIVGAVSTGGPSPPGQLHIGVRLDGHYIDPLPFFGKIPRAVLLPCC